MNELQSHDLAHLKEAEWLVGIDEAGRGALAGPVMAGACVLHRTFFSDTTALARSALINDSKQLSAEAREAQYGLLCELRDAKLVDFEVASGSVEEIAHLNILGATRLAMQRAVEALGAKSNDWELPPMSVAGPLFDRVEAVRILVDGRPLKPFPYKHEGIVKGDGRSVAIAMASIAAKVSRDQAMRALGKAYPAYGLEKHKGYGTAAHRAVLHQMGPSPIHRSLFMRKILSSAE